MTKKFTLSDEDKRLFAEAVAASKPLTQKKHHKEKTKPTEEPSFAYRRYQASKAIETNNVAIVTAESPLLFRRTSVSDKKIQQLQQGIFPRPAVLDLHGLSEAEAITHLNDFIYQAQQRKASVVLIVHGKGSRNNPNPPILKNAVNEHLRHLDAVLAFCSARIEDGGHGAVYVLLKMRS